jgi:hypothetical protein
MAQWADSCFIKNGVEVDVDSWNVTIRPEDLFGNYMLMDTVVHLMCHAPQISDCDYYEDWVFVGRAGFFIRVDPLYADDVFDQLVLLGGLRLCRSSYETVLITGSQNISGGLLVRALQAAGVGTVRLNAFGMKAKLVDVEHNFGHESPQDSHFNSFDIGIMIPSDDITLFRPKKKTLSAVGQPKGTVYPMLLELGMGMGSVSFQEVEEAEISKIKVYPGLVHAIKATSAKHMAGGPKTARTWHTKLKSIAKKVERLSTQKVDLSGFRVEVTVHAKTVNQAIEIALDSGYLHRPTSRLRLKSMTVDSEEYMDYIGDLIDLAKQKLKVTKSHNQIIPLADLQRQGIADVTNGYGWNNGRFRVTQWDDEKAWFRPDVGQ